MDFRGAESGSLEHRSFSLPKEKPSIFLNEWSSILKPKESKPVQVAQLIANLFATQLLWTPDTEQRRAKTRPKPSFMVAQESPKKKFKSLVLEGTTSPVCDRPKPLKVDIERIMTMQHKRTPYTTRFTIEKIPQELSIQFKEWCYWEWHLMLNHSSGLAPVPTELPFKFYIGKGNNASLIEFLMKNRWWWVKVDSPALANFVWTPNKHWPTLNRIGPAQLLSNTTKLNALWPKLPRKLVQEKLDAYGHGLIRNARDYKKLNLSEFEPSILTIHNRVIGSHQICCKKNLLKTMSRYYTQQGVKVFTRIPLTFHISTGTDPELERFSAQFKSGSVWIVKPGEHTSQGVGITVCVSLKEIKSIVEQAGEGRTYVIQKYIRRPLLINRRKFDIRCYGLICCQGKQLQTYFYREGYVRTSCKEFTLKNIKNKYIHLTNDAIQKTAEGYGRFENGNKLSYSELQKYLKSTQSNLNFYSGILPQIRSMVADTMKAMQEGISQKTCTFELIGYDFLIDNKGKAWLIEVNSNPCLELSSPYLACLIPQMVDNALRIAVDPLFPPSKTHRKYRHWVKDAQYGNNFELVSSKILN